MTRFRFGVRDEVFVLERVTKVFLKVFLGDTQRSYFMGRATNIGFGTRGANFVLCVDVGFFWDARLERAA